MGTYKPYGTGLKESDRYGNLLEKAKQKEPREKLDILKSIDKIM